MVGTPSSDVVYVGGRVLSEDGTRTLEATLWTHGDRIAAIGPEEDLRRGAGTAADIVRLDGAVVLPGFIDAHCHVTQDAFLLAGVDCSQPAAPDIRVIQERLAAAEPLTDGWVMGSGFAEYKLAERRMPTRRDLDDAVPDLPCVLYQVSLHAGVVNSAGLHALGFDDSTPDPPGGRLGRDAEGRLDGALYEQPLFDLQSTSQARIAERSSAEERIAAIERAAIQYASYGVTSCTDAATDAAGYESLRLAEEAGRLPIRTVAMVWYEDAVRWLFEERVPVGSGSDRLSVGGVKLFADGGLTSRTAAVERPYEVPAGEVGVLIQPPEALAAQARHAADTGFRVGIHAQGDRGIRAALDALEPIGAGGNPMRNRIEHGAVFSAPLRARAAAARIHVMGNPQFLSVLGDGILEAFGRERSRGIYPFASLRDAGVIVAGSSDSPVVTISPLVGIRNAVIRRTDGGRPIGPEESVSAAEALAMYTSRGAFMEFREGELGTLTAGRAADLVVLDGDPLTVDPASIADLRVRRTVVGGVVVFEADAARP